MIEIKKAKIGLLTTIIVILLIFVMLLIVYYRFIPKFLGKSNMEICRSSVLAQSVTMQAVPGGQKMVEPECFTTNIKFYENRVEVNTKPIEVLDSRKKDVVKKFDGLTNEIVNEVIAEELRWCWYQFLEGKKKVLSRSFIKFQGEAPQICFLCAEILFDTTVKKDEFTGFYQFTIGKVMPNSYLTYYSYYAEEPRICESFGEGGCWEDYFREEIAKPTKWETPDKTSFKKDTKYVVAFVKRGQEAYAATIGFGFHENYFAYVLPSFALANTCEDGIIRGAIPMGVDDTSG